MRSMKSKLPSATWGLGTPWGEEASGPLKTVAENNSRRKQQSQKTTVVENKVMPAGAWARDTSRCRLFRGAGERVGSEGGAARRGRLLEERLLLLPHLRTMPRGPRPGARLRCGPWRGCGQRTCSSVGASKFSIAAALQHAPAPARAPPPQPGAANAPNTRGK